MAEFYLDHGAYGISSNRLGLDTPTWGVPQEGDGSSPSPSTSSSICSIKFSSVPTTGTISVCGASVATTGVIGAANANAAADALAANINATTNTVSTTFANSGVPTGANTLNNIVYARGPSNGAPAGTCQIMARIGTTKYNGQVGIAHTFNGSPTTTTFSGGVGGCWGWLINPSALGVGGAIAALAYGVGVSVPTVWLSTPDDENPVWVRTGTSPTVTIGGNYSRGVVGFRLRLIFDTNKRWASDTENGVFTLRYYGANDFSFYPQGGVGGTTSTAQIECVRQSNFVVSFGCTASGKRFWIGPQSGSYATLKGVKFVIESISTNGRFRIQHSSYNQAALRAFGCIFDASAIATPTLPEEMINATNYADNFRGYFSGCQFLWNLNGSPPDLIAICKGFTDQSYYSVLSFVDCSFSSGTSAKLKLIEGTGGRLFNTINAIRCTGIYTSNSYTNIIGADQYNFSYRVGFQSAMPDREFRVEMTGGCVRWNPSASPAFPTLSALLPNGNPWSIAAEWSSITNTIEAGSEFQLPHLTQISRGVTGTKTITVQFLCPSSLSNSDLTSLIYVTVTWVQPNGIQKTLYTTYVQDSTASWNGASNYPGYVAKKITLQTDTPVLQYTDVSVLVGFSRSCPLGQTTLVFFDPEFTIE